MELLDSMVLKAVGPRLACCGRIRHERARCSGVKCRAWGWFGRSPSPSPAATASVVYPYTVLVSSIVDAVPNEVGVGSLLLESMIIRPNCSSTSSAEDGGNILPDLCASYAMQGDLYTAF